MATPIELEGTDQTLESPKENDPMMSRKLKQFEEFGLGRGVDATDPTPFVNKKPFQVRPIDSEDAIICTDEGGALQSIIQKIESSRSVQMKVSLTIPKPIEIEAPAEYSRSIMQKGHILGRKVVTRTVAFRKDCVIGKNPTDFENFLKTYIDKADADVGKKRSSKLLESIKTIAPSDDSNRILSLLEFIAENGITHYVSKIHLGAAQYSTMSETSYSSFVSGKQHLGLEKIAHLAVDRKDENTTHLDEVKRIGYMDDGYVVKKDEQEGVVDVQLESIANLISDEKLKKELTAALNIYTYLSGLHTIGSKMDDAIPYDQQVELVKFIRPLNRPPSKHEASHKYAICCDLGGDKLFLDIKSGSNQVIATKCEGQLNFFNLQLTEKPDELIIVDYAEFSTRTETLVEDLSYDFWPTPRYLKVKTLLGYNCGPLCVEDSVDEYYCRLKLCPRLYSKHKNVTVNDFTNGKDTFYICTSGRWGMTGYLYLKPTKDGDFITACKPRWNWMYNGGGNSHKHMLFRLVRYENMYVPDPTRTNNIAKLSPIENENATTAGTEDNMGRRQEESRAKCSSVHTALYKPVFGLFLLSVLVLLAALYWRK